MKLYFNPNAAPQTLYPVIPLLLALNNDVVIWDPNPAHVEAHLNGDLWLGLLRDPGDGARLTFLHSTWARETLEAQADRNIVARSTVERLSPILERTPEMKAAIQSWSRLAWGRLDELERQELAGEMRVLSDDLRTKNPEILDRLSANFQISSEFPEACMLFDSVVQDIAMLMVSGAGTPLSEPARWTVYSAALRSLSGSLMKREPEFDIADDLDDTLRAISDLSRPLSSQRVIDIEQVAIVGRLLHYVEGMNDISFSEFQGRRREFGSIAREFASGLQAVMDSPLLRRTSITGRLVELNELIQVRRTRYERAAGLISVIAGGGGAATSGSLELVLAGLGMAGILPVNPFGLSDRLAQVGLPRKLLSRRMRIVLQRPDVWIDLLKADKSAPAPQRPRDEARRRQEGET